MLQYTLSNDPQLSQSNSPSQNLAAENAANQLRNLSLEDQTSQNFQYQYIKQSKAKYLNGWAETQLSPKQTARKKQKFLLANINIKNKNRKCKTNNQCVSFRYCQKYDTLEKQQQHIAQTARKWNVPSNNQNKPELKMKNILPIDLSLCGVQTPTKVNNTVERKCRVTKKTFMVFNRNVFSKSTAKNKGNYDSRKMMTTRNDFSSKKGLCNMDYSNSTSAIKDYSQREINNEKKHQNKKNTLRNKLLKANHPAYFDFRNSMRQQFQFLLTRLSPKQADKIQKYDRQKGEFPSTIKSEFLELIQSRNKGKSINRNKQLNLTKLTGDDENEDLQLYKLRQHTFRHKIKKSHIERVATIN